MVFSMACSASLSIAAPPIAPKSNAWMLHFVQHDKTENVIPSESEESKQMEYELDGLNRFHTD